MRRFLWQIQTLRYIRQTRKRARVVSRLADVLSRELDVAFACLYGSFIDAASFHDIDIGVYMRNVGQDGHDAPALHRRIEEAVPFPVDVRILNDAPVSFLYHVFQGRLIYIKDEERLTDLMEDVARRYHDMAPLLRQSMREAFTG